jgi:hypothetical protein
MTTDFLYLRINGNERKWIEKVKQKERELNVWDGGGREALDFAIVVVDNPAKANHIPRGCLTEISKISASICT